MDFTRSYIILGLAALSFSAYADLPRNQTFRDCVEDASAIPGKIILVVDPSKIGRADEAFDLLEDFFGSSGFDYIDIQSAVFEVGVDKKKKPISAPHRLVFGINDPFVKAKTHEDKAAIVATVDEILSSLKEKYPSLRRTLCVSKKSPQRTGPGTRVGN